MDASIQYDENYTPEPEIETLVLTGLNGSGEVITECAVPKELHATAYMAMGMLDGQESYYLPCEIEPELADTLLEGAGLERHDQVFTWELICRDTEGKHANIV